MKNTTTTATVQEAAQEVALITSKRNNITFSLFGEFVKNYDKDTISISKSAFEKAGIPNYANLNNLAKRLYIAVSHMMELRESNADKSDITDAENTVKALADSFYLEIGTRPAHNKQDKPRPSYGVRYADFALFGEMVNSALTMVKNDVTKVTDKFFEILIVATNRLLNGKALSRISEIDIAKAKKEIVKAKAEKSAETKAENKSKLEETEEQLATAKAEIEALKSNSINISELISMIQNSHATNDEKLAMIKFLNPNKKSEIATTSEINEVA